MCRELILAGHQAPPVWVTEREKTMRFYQVEIVSEQYGHLGSVFSTSKRGAKLESRRIEHPGRCAGDASYLLVPIDIEPTKAGILQALNDLAAHPNNG